MKLSDLRGSYVLIDGHGPRRRENPNVVRAYDKYRKAKFKDADGFEVFSVSLDSDILVEAAIKKDDLSWKHHVSDLKKWKNEAAAMYGVSSIPMSFLVDPNGIIVAKNLRTELQSPAGQIRHSLRGAQHDERARAWQRCQALVTFA